MHASLILNGAAGALSKDGKHSSAPSVTEALGALGITVDLLDVTGDRLRETVSAAMRTHPDMIIVGGGDGTLNTAAGCLAGSDIPLGILPLGTLNHFARDLGIPQDWREAASIISEGRARSVDVGEVNGRVFINNCSIGSYAEAVRKRDLLRQAHGLGKWWAMIAATFSVFRRLRRVRLRVETDDAQFSLRTPFVVVSNNRYSGRVLDHSLRTRLDEARLWIYTTRAHRHGAILRFAWQSLRRRIDEVEGLETHAASHIRISHDYGRVPIALDGELVSLDSPFEFRTRPGALRVIAPAVSATAQPGPAQEAPALP